MTVVFSVMVSTPQETLSAVLDEIMRRRGNLIRRAAEAPNAAQKSIGLLVARAQELADLYSFLHDLDIVEPAAPENTTP